MVDPAGARPLARALSADELARAGVHQERGRERIDYILALTAGHDLLHLRQIRRIMAAAPLAT